MTRKIMIIDDEPDIRVYLAAATEDKGFDPVTVDAEMSVMEKIIDHKPDLIILDIMMPMRSGISIYKEIRTSPPWHDIPIILISGMSGISDFMDSGFRKLIGDDKVPPPNGFVEKPVDIDLLFKQVTTLLDQ